MDVSKLTALPTDVLVKLRDTVDAVIASRMDTRLQVGRLATFEYSGTTREVRIDKVNTKTVSCRETSASIEPGKLWRVSIPVVKVIPMERETPLPIKVDTPHKPASYEDAGAW